MNLQQEVCQGLIQFMIFFPGKAVISLSVSVSNINSFSNNWITQFIYTAGKPPG